MKKICLLFIIMTSFLLHAVDAYDNPFWERGVNYEIIEGKNPFVIARPQIIAEFAIPIDYLNGVYFGLFYQGSGEFRISKIFNFRTSMRLGPDIPFINTLGTSWAAYPLPFLKLETSYQFGNFYKYSAAEHNISTALIFLFDLEKMPRWIDVEWVNALNIRLIDTDTRANTLYPGDVLIEIFYGIRIKLMFHPSFFFSTGLSVGNHDDYATHTSNYWQVEFHNYFHLPKGFSIFIDSGFAFSGSVPFAGIVNRGWGSVGVRYGIKEL